MVRYFLVAIFLLATPHLVAAEDLSEGLSDDILATQDIDVLFDIEYLGTEDTCVSLPVCLGVACTVSSLYKDTRTGKITKIKTTSGTCRDWYGQCLCSTY